VRIESNGSCLEKNSEVEYDIYYTQETLTEKEVKEEKVEVKEGEVEKDKIEKIVQLILDLNQGNFEFNQAMSANMNKTISTSFDKYVNIQDASITLFAREINEKNNFFEVCKSAYEPKT